MADHSAGKGLGSPSKSDGGQSCTWGEGLGLGNTLAKIPLEIEIKLRVADRDDLQRRLASLKAQATRPRVHEMNTLYDTRGGALARRGQMLRVRVERATGGLRRSGKASDGDGYDTVTLTYKGPVENAVEGAHRKGRGNGSAHQSEGANAGRNLAGQQKTGVASQDQRRVAEVQAAGRYKVREEREVRASDARAIAEIIEALGLAPQFRYEKYRSTYRLPGIAGVVVEFDETPIGDFLELEGRREAIDRAAARLGFSRAEYITDNYGALYAKNYAEAGGAMDHNELGGQLKVGEMLFRTGA